MKKFYLIMTIIGFAVPNYFVLRQSLLTDNWLLWRKPLETSELVFANFASSAFMTDLMILLPIFFIWMIYEASNINMKRVWLYIPLALLFGLSFALPLFLYVRQRHLEQPVNQQRLETSRLNQLHRV